jgi:hypothetical protein
MLFFDTAFWRNIKSYIPPKQVKIVYYTRIMHDGNYVRALLLLK